MNKQNGSTHVMTQETPKPTRPASRRPIVLLGIIISLVFLFLAFRNLHPQQFLESLREVDVLLLVAGAALYFVAVSVIALRWQFLLRGVRYVALLPLTGIVAVGYMGNNVYPLRAGEALRILLLRRSHAVPVAGSATTVVVERAFDGIVMLTFMLLGVLLVDVQAEEIQLVANVGAPVFLLAVLVFFVLAAFPNLLSALVQRVANLLPQRLGDLLRGLSDGIIEGLNSLRSPVHLAGAVLASYATWAIEAGVYWIVMTAFGLDLPYAAALLVVGTVNLAGLIPASPGQVGVYEFFASAVLVGLGVAPDTALAYAVVVHLVIWLPVTVVGFFVLVQHGLRWSDIRKARELEAQLEG